MLLSGPLPRPVSRSLSPSLPNRQATTILSTLPKLGALEVDPTTDFIIHPLQSRDTLQGLAITYGVTVEAIKRQNKLLSSDSNSLFLRQTLLIPTTKDQVRQKLGLFAREQREKTDREEEAVLELIEETGATKEAALSFLKQANMNIEEAREKLFLSQVVHDRAKHSKPSPSCSAPNSEATSLSYGTATNLRSTTPYGSAPYGSSGVRLNPYGAGRFSGLEGSGTYNRNNNSQSMYLS